MDRKFFKLKAEHPKKPITIKKLREYLDSFEASWTEEDERYLGKFEDHILYIPFYSEEGIFEGYGWASVFYDGGLDFILDRGDLDGR